jgi:hypothetical protein
MSTVVKFPVRPPAGLEGWHQDELRRILSACSGTIATGEASGWDIGITEGGEPQVYLIGPPPSYDCILCISRVGRNYIIEDGRGQVLLEHDSPMLFAEKAIAALRSQKAVLLAKVAVAWQTFRDAFEEKAEALSGESMEVLAHIAPQLATLV